MLKIRKFYVIMAHFRRRRQRKIFLAKKEAIKRANKVYLEILRNSGMLLWSKKVAEIIKFETQKKALHKLLGTVYHIKIRRRYIPP